MPTTVENDSVKTPPPYQPEKGAQVVTGDTPRQGPAGTRGLIIMVVSTIGAFVVCALALYIFRGAFNP